MVRQTFHNELEELQSDILIMGSMVEKAIARSIKALQNRSMGLAEQIVQDDELINQKRYEIEESCVRLIATQQPMASDLRMIISAIHVATDLERMGDYAAGIAEITLLLRDDPRLKPLVDIPKMAEIDIERLQDGLRSFVDRDAERAKRNAARDDDIDSLYHKVLSKSISEMIENPENVPIATRIIWVGHKLERIGDRVTNICERVVFTATGRMEELDAGD